MLRWMVVITERLDGGGAADGEAEKRDRKNLKYRRTKTHDGRGWKSDERKKKRTLKTCAVVRLLDNKHHRAICLR